jgi:ABC-type hemin transport system substrate-binding protein
MNVRAFKPCCAALLLVLAGAAQAATPAELLAGYSAKAGAAAAPDTISICNFSR